MSTVTTIILAILIFGFLIFVHEFGHYFFARLFKVKIHEFSIGMGPKIIQYKSKKTGINYAVSAVPIGGYVAMAGENDESDDPNSFDKKPAWQRFIITVAGAAVNITVGFIVLIIYTSLVNIGGTVVGEFVPETDTGYEISTEDQGLMIYDRIIEVDGRRVAIADQLSYEIMRRGHEPIDLTVLRNGERIVLEDVTFPTISESGQTFGMMDFKVFRAEKTVGSVLNYSFAKGVLMLRMCYESIADLITGRYSFEAVSGPVGISTAIGDAAKAGVEPLLYLTALISINLGVMNLLPIPALDGGRILTILIEMITRKRLPVKVEGVINAVGLVLLLGLSAVILVKDVLQLIF
ncbi:MAG: site-2 protease family protein [Clostridia bacterium]|nr:site-2 protease family protein [Clostridia bacterium]